MRWCSSVGVTFIPLVVESLGGWSEEAICRHHCEQPSSDLRLLSEHGPGCWQLQTRCVVARWKSLTRPEQQGVPYTRLAERHLPGGCKTLESMMGFPSSEQEQLIVRLRREHPGGHHAYGFDHHSHRIPPGGHRRNQPPTHVCRMGIQTPCSAI